MPSDKAKKLVHEILDSGVVTRCADLIDAHTAEAVADYKRVLDEAFNMLCMIDAEYEFSGETMENQTRIAINTTIKNTLPFLTTKEGRLRIASKLKGQ